MRDHRFTAILAVLSLMLGAAVAQAGEDVPAARFADPTRREKLARALPVIEARVEEAARELRLPGAAYGVVIDGELVLVKGLGLRDVASKAPADADTVFRIASMTKSFTALAILKLRDAGKLALDDPAGRYLPELATMPPPTKDSGPITIRQLLSHTAGFPEDNPWGDRQLDTSNEELSAWLRAGIPFSTASGTAFEYSNYGFALLGQIVSRVSGMRYEDYITREILRPLGMASTYWDPQAVPRDRLATGYKRDGTTVEAQLADGTFGAMGGLLTTARDLSRWVALMLSAWPPRDDPERPPALRRSLREMQQGLGVPRFVIDRTVPGAPPTVRAANYGFGLGSSQDCLVRFEVSHGGGLPGFGSDMRWLPEYGVGLFALSNVTYGPARRLTREMMTALTDTGALEPRRPVPAPALVQAVAETARLLDTWDDGRARALAAENLFLDQPLEARRDDIAKLREGLGACRAGEIEAENALRGRFRMTCDKGWLDVYLTLAPTQPPRVQDLDVTAARPLSDDMRRAVDAVVASIVRGSQGLRLAPTLSAGSLGALLESVHQRYGTCRLGEPVEGDGAARTLVKLDCDRGAAEMLVRLEEGRLADVRIGPAAGTVCPP
jgi:CubicO group peptidase (beta-lactamase class C family)